MYILFFALTWVLNLIICGIIGSLYYNENNEITVNIYGFSMLFLPTIVSTLETLAFNKKWDKNRNSNYPYIASDEGLRRYEDAPCTTPQRNAPCASVHLTEPENINTALVNSLVSCFRENPSLQPARLASLDAFAKYGGVDAELLTIDLMEGHDFEQWCATALRDMGYTDVEVTPGSGDQGVDVVASKDGVKYAIQCKRYTSDLGNTPVQEVHAGKNLYRCHVGAVLTNRYFTRGAKELAEATGVLLWDRDWIKQYLDTKVYDDGFVAIPHEQSVSPISDYATSSHDELLFAAIDVVVTTGQASVSMLQRKLKLEYVRAARIMDDIEAIGVVGPFQGSRPREIYITEAEWNVVLSTIQC